MAKKSRFGTITKELIDELKRQWPDEVPSITDSDREIGAKIGEQRVIRRLLMEYKEQIGGEGTGRLLDGFNIEPATGIKA